MERLGKQHFLAVLTVWLIVVCCYLLPFISMAQGKKYSPNQTQDAILASMPKLKFRHISGLNNNQVNAIKQDKRGYIWVGTLNGLHKYNGTNFELFLHDYHNPKTINHNRIETIFEDSSGTLWVGTSDGVCRYDCESNSFERIKSLRKKTVKNSPHSHRVNDFREDKDGTLWIISNREGLLYFDDDLQAFEPYILPARKNQFETEYFSAFEIDENGLFWLGTFDQGIYVLNPQTQFIEHLANEPENPNSLSGNIINDIVLGKDNTIWVGTNRNGVNKIRQKVDEKIITNYRYDVSNPFTLQNNDVAALYVDNQKRLWSCNENGGLNLYNDKLDGFFRYVADVTDPNSMSSTSIWSMHQDIENRIWIGTGLTGIDIYDPFYYKFDHYFVSVNSINGMSSNLTRHFWEDENKDIWIATDGGGLLFFDRSKDRFKSYQYDPLDPKSVSVDAVLCIEDDPDGNLWLGTWSGGVNIFDRKNKQFKVFNTPDHINLDNVFDCLRDSRNNFWFATYQGGLIRYNWDTKEFGSHYHDPDDPKTIGSDMMHTLFEDSKGNIYIGIRLTGLNVLRKENIEKGMFDRYEFDPAVPDGITSNDVNDIYEDPDGVVWIATSKGLLTFDVETGRFTRMDEGTNLLNEDIRSIIEDDKGQLWARSHDGISKFDRATKTFKNYAQAEGVQKGSFLRHTLFKTEKGELLFGGDKGFNLFHPDSLQNSRNPPEVYFTDLKIFNQSVEIDADTSVLKKHIAETESFTLPDDYWKFRLEFVAINYTRPENNEYAYRMEGLEDDWSYIGNQQSATYTNLPPGNYTFRVKAANNDGIWNEVGASIKIKILPAWWQTWWAKMCYIMGGIGVFFIFIRMRTRKLKRDRQRLEELIQERTKELKEKNTEIILQAEELKRKNEEQIVLNQSISEQAEELRTYNDALNAMNENLEKIVDSRTQILTVKNQELIAYSFANAHNVRGPLTRIMGLINIVKTDQNADREELLSKMELATAEMDQITRDIGQKLDQHIKEAE